MLIQHSSEVIQELASRYGFDAETEISHFREKFISSLATPSKKTKTKAASKKSLKDNNALETALDNTSDTASETASDKHDKIKWKLPFNGVLLEDCCRALCKNDGLFTQCEKKKVTDFCKACDAKITIMALNWPHRLWDCGVGFSLMADQRMA